MEHRFYDMLVANIIKMEQVVAKLREASPMRPLLQSISIEAN